MIFLYAAGGDADRQLYETLGLMVLVLSAARILRRLAAARPDPADVARWMGIR